MNAPGVRITPFHLMGLAPSRACVFSCFIRVGVCHVTVTCTPRSPVAPASPQILGDWFERGSIIVFVDTKEAADGLFLELAKAGYPALSLHGGKDQVRRQQQAAAPTPARTPHPASRRPRADGPRPDALGLPDGRAHAPRRDVSRRPRHRRSGGEGEVPPPRVCVHASRNLPPDPQACVLVVNYSCPNHIEDYVHRVGRTGRAGRSGTAITFITPSEGQYAADLMRALRDAKQPQHVTPELKALADAYATKVAAGEARKHRSGYGGSGFKFDGTELSADQQVRGRRGGGGRGGVAGSLAHPLILPSHCRWQRSSGACSSSSRA